MKNRLKKLFLIGSIILFIVSFFLKPLIEYNDIDFLLFKKMFFSFSIGLLLSAILVNIKGKCSKFISIMLLVLALSSSIYFYNSHSTDYKTRNKLYFISLIKKDILKNDAVTVASADNNVSKPLNDAVLRVNYIDVGQGDSTLIELPNKEIMLIDAGEKNQAQKVISYIKNLGYNKIDYVIGTHPHSDHIGGLEDVVNTFDIGKIYMPKKASNSKTFANLLLAIKNKGLKVNTGKNGISIVNTDDLKLELIAPVKEYMDANNNSLVLSLTYKNRRFLFMGDAEVSSEKDIDKSVKCDVVKIGHHGSDTASSTDFVNKTNASYVVISVGKNNIYKHPYDTILKRWQDSGAKIYRTDQLGNIVITTDGNSLNINNNDEVINKLDTSDIAIDDQQSNIKLESVSVVKGKMSEIKIKGNPNTEYSIKLYYASGLSKAKGLDAKISDNNGYVTWNFKTSASVKSGTYKFIISDKDNEESFNYEVK